MYIDSKSVKFPAFVSDCSCPGWRGAAHGRRDGWAAAAEHGLWVPVSPGGGQEVRGRRSACIISCISADIQPPFSPNKQLFWVLEVESDLDLCGHPFIPDSDLLLLVLRWIGRQKVHFDDIFCKLPVIYWQQDSAFGFIRSGLMRFWCRVWPESFTSTSCLRSQFR